MRVKEVLKIFGIALCLCGLAGTPASADPTMVNIGVKASEDLLLIEGILVDGFTESMEEAIESGVPMTLNFFVELRQEGSVFGDKLIGSNTIRHTIQYDSLKKVYKYQASGKNIKQKVLTHSRKKSQNLMMTLKDIPLAPIYKLEPNEKYFVRVKAELEADEFFFPFNYLLFFLPFDGFETSWSETSPLTLEPNPAYALEANQKASPNKQGGKAPPAKSLIRSFNQ